MKELATSHWLSD